MSVLKLYNKIANGKTHMFDDSTEVEAQCIIPPAMAKVLRTLVADQFFNSYSWSNKHGKKVQ